MSNITFHWNIDQGSEQWHELKSGKLSASHANTIKANGAGLKTYSKDKVNELLNSKEEGYYGVDMERGTILEPEAFEYYALITGYDVKDVGFIENILYPNAGCSPDGVIPTKKGGIEIKARNAQKHLSLILGETKEIPYDQIQMCLMITEYDWWDFISYNPNFKEKPMFIKRFYPDKELFTKLHTGIISGNKLINDFMTRYNNYSNISYE